MRQRVQRAMSFVLSLVLMLSALSIQSFAASNIVINGVDIGYANGSFFTKDGKTCKNYKSGFADGTCHKHDLNCEISTNSRCNCMRFWPTGYEATCQVDLKASQCFGYARYCQWRVYGQYATDDNPRNFVNLLSTSSYNGATLKAALRNCAPATHVRVGYHSIVIIDATDYGVNVTDCNASNRDCHVRYTTFSWDGFATELKKFGYTIYSAYSWKGGNSSPPSVSKPSTSSPVYALAPASGLGKRLDVESWSTASQANIQIYNASGGQNQKFIFENAGDGWYTIKSAHSGMALDMAGTRSGANVWQYTPNGTDAQKWKLVDTGDGYYKIVPKLNTSVCLDVSGAYNTNGANVQVWTDNGTVAQKWKLIALPGSGDVTAELSVNTSQINRNESVTFSFGGKNCGSSFTLGIYKDGNRCGAVSVSGNSYTYTCTEAGNYSAYMTSYSSFALADSNWVEWKVSNSSGSSLDSRAATYSQYLPMKAMLLQSTRLDCYNSYGTSSKAGRIYEDDQVTIQEIRPYNGELWCKLSCPWSGGYNRTVYAPLRYFFANPSYNSWSSYYGERHTTYWRANGGTTAGYADKWDPILVVGEMGGRYQIIYPLSSGGYKLAFG